MATVKETFFGGGEILHKIGGCWTHPAIPFSEICWQNKEKEVVSCGIHGEKWLLLWGDNPRRNVAEIIEEYSDFGNRFLTALVNPEIAGVKIVDKVWQNLPFWTGGSDGWELEEKIKNCCDAQGLCSTGWIAVSLEVWFRRNRWKGVFPLS